MYQHKDLTAKQYTALAQQSGSLAEFRAVVDSSAHDCGGIHRANWIPDQLALDIVDGNGLRLSLDHDLKTGHATIVRLEIGADHPWAAQ